MSVRTAARSAARLRHHALRALLPLSLLAGAARAQSLPTPQSLAARHDSIIGGRPALEAHQSLRLMGSFAIPDMGLDAPIEILKRRPNQYLMRANLGPLGDMLSGYDGTVAWTVQPGSGALILEGEMATQVRDQADFFGDLHDYSRFSRVETVGEEEFGGRRAWRVRMVRASGDTLVLPLDDRRIERLNSDLAGRPVLIRGRSQLLFSGMGRLSENSLLNLKNKSHSVTAEVVLPDRGASGVIIAQGGALSGWSLYARDGRLKYCYNLLGLQRFYTESASTLPAGLHQVRMEFAYDGGGLAKGGNVTLFVDGDKVGEGRIPATLPMVFSPDETTDVGYESASPLAEDYTMHTSAFNGKINWIQLDAGVGDHDHFISPEERLRLAMVRQ